MRHRPILTASVCFGCMATFKLSATALISRGKLFVAEIAANLARIVRYSARIEFSAEEVD